MALEIKKMWIELGELRDRMQRFKNLKGEQAFHTWPKNERKQWENMALRINSYENNLQKAGKNIPITILLLYSIGGVNEPDYAMYTTHDDDELAVLFKRDFPGRQVYRTLKVFTATLYRDF